MEPPKGDANDSEAETLITTQKSIKIAAPTAHNASGTAARLRNLTHHGGCARETFRWFFSYWATVRGVCVRRSLFGRVEKTAKKRPADVPSQKRKISTPACRYPFYGTAACCRRPDPGSNRLAFASPNAVPLRQGEFVLNPTVQRRPPEIGYKYRSETQRAKQGPRQEGDSTPKRLSRQLDDRCSGTAENGADVVRARRFISMHFLVAGFYDS